MKDKKNNTPRATLLARILCIVLVALMLLGTASTVILFLFAYSTPSSAASYSEPIMTIGIQYGSTAVSSYRTYSNTGYTVGSQVPDGARGFTSFGTLSDKTLIVAPHANLAPSGTGFAPASSGVTVGGYRVELKKSYSSYSEALTIAESLSSALSSKGYQAFPAYIGGSFFVRVGCFADSDSAEGAKSTVASAAGADTSVVSPSGTAVTVLTPESKIRFEYENGTSAYLGLRPVGNDDVYMRADNNYIYEGTFMYMRTDNALTIISVVPLETYIEGVLPYEISPSWHMESQKAFSIAARSYAMGNRGKHYKAYGFDTCCTTCCQVYRGAGGTNDTVRSAVAATAGKILMYNGKIATLYYSASTGGCTVSSKDCWGGTGAGYLTAISTPWERYTNHSKAFWTVEKTPEELCQQLRNKGYTTLTGSIKSFEVLELAQDSTYVKSVKITDTSGNSVTITNTDKIRIALGFNSANFVVGRGSVAYTVSTVTASTETLPYNVQSMSQFNTITSAGQIPATLTGNAKIATGGGVIDSSSYEYVITADNYENGGDTVAGGYKTTCEDKTATASSSDNFIFVGKGWGHGVGLSQYGTKDLAEFGYPYDKILKAYVPLAEIKTVADLGF